MTKDVFNAYKIELEKIIKRKDIFIIFIFLGISILIASSVLSPEYKDINNQSAIYWTCKQIFNSSIFMVSPMLSAYIGTKMLSSEITNESIILYTIRIKDRKCIYIGKSLALLTFVTIIFIMVILINLLIYYIIVVKNPLIASNTFWGENRIYIIITMIMLYFSSFVLSAEFTLFLGAFFNQTKSISIVFLVSLILNNTFKVPFIRLINPLYYVIRLSDEITSTTSSIEINFSHKIIFIILFSILSFAYICIFNIVGSDKFKRSEL